MIEISLMMSELIYDIENQTHLIARMSGPDKSEESRANIQADNGDAAVNQIVRSIDVAFSALRSALTEYTPQGHDIAGNILPGDGAPQEEIERMLLTLILDMPLNFDASQSEPMARMAHRYVVDMALADWCRLKSLRQESDYREEATALLQDVIVAAHRRVRPQRYK